MNFIRICTPENGKEPSNLPKIYKRGNKFNYWFDPQFRYVRSYSLIPGYGSLYEPYRICDWPLRFYIYSSYFHLHFCFNLLRRGGYSSQIIQFGGSKWLLFHYDADHGCSYLFDGSSQVASFGQTFSTNTKYYFDAVYSNPNMYFYVNGRYIGMYSGFKNTTYAAVLNPAKAASDSRWYMEYYFNDVLITDDSSFPTTWDWKDLYCLDKTNPHHLLTNEDSYARV